MPWMLVITAVVLIAGYLFMPKPNMPNAKSGSLDDISVPTNNNGRPISECFGTVEVSGNIMWYGDFEEREIRSKG